MSGLKLNESLLSLARAAPLLEHWVARTSAASVGKKRRRPKATSRMKPATVDRVTGQPVDTRARDAELDAFFDSVGLPPRKEGSAKSLPKRVKKPKTDQAAKRVT